MPGFAGSFGRMTLTVIALAILTLSTALLLGNLRLVAQDTLSALRTSIAQARASGQILPRMAFAALWLLIFALSYF